MVVDLDNTSRMLSLMMMVMMMMMMIMMMKIKMAITRSIFELGPQDFAW